jgi:hexosaminidase
MRLNRVLLSLLMVACIFVANGQQVERGIAIIPEPVKVVKKGGHFVVPDNVTISVSSKKDANFVANLLKEKLSVAPG